MEPSAALSILEMQLDSMDLAATAKRIGQGFCKQGYILLSLQDADVERITAANVLLRDLTGSKKRGLNCPVPLTPSKRPRGRNIFSYSLGQSDSNVPPSWAHTAAQALEHAGEAVLAALTKSPILNIKTTAFNEILDDPVLNPGQVSSSVLDAIQYLSLSQASSGCQPHVDKGLLTLVTADADGLQVYSPSQNSFQTVSTPAGHVAVLPGYTLERATCGLIKASVHQVVLGNAALRTSLAFKLRAPPSAVLNLYPQLPLGFQQIIESRYAGPISVAELMWLFDQTHQSINAQLDQNLRDSQPDKTLRTAVHSLLFREEMVAAELARQRERDAVETARLESLYSHPRYLPANQAALRKAPQAMLLHVKTLTGQTLTLWAEPDWLVYGVAVMLQTLGMPPPVEQRFIFGHRRLELGHTLKHYDIQQEATIYLTLRLFGD